jgi:hypothetical protein
VRHVILSEDGFNIADDAYHRLLAVCFFPESPRDQAQAISVAAMEREEFLRVGADHYKPSEIMQVVARHIEKRATQLYSVGLVALSYFWLSATPYRPSLNRASIVASYSACEFGKVTWRPDLNPSGPEKIKPVTGDAATLERIFRKYRSVAHICAARTSAGDYLASDHIWDQSPFVIEALIQTSVTFQDALEKATDVSSWKLWDLKKYYPTCLSGSPVLVPSDDLFFWIKRGYDLAVADGKLVKQDGGR